MDEQPALRDDLLRQAAQQMEQQPPQPQQLPPLLNLALVVRAGPGAGLPFSRLLRMTPSGLGVGDSLSVYGRLDQRGRNDAGTPRPPRRMVACVKVHKDRAAAVPTTSVKLDYRYEATMWGFFCNVAWVE